MVLLAPATKEKKVTTVFWEAAMVVHGAATVVLRELTCTAMNISRRGCFGVLYLWVREMPGELPSCWNRIGHTTSPIPRGALSLAGLTWCASFDWLVPVFSSMGHFFFPRDYEEYEIWGGHCTGGGSTCTSRVWVKVFITLAKILLNYFH